MKYLSQLTFLVIVLPFFLFSETTISFIIPCYNVDSYVERAVQSIYAQNLSIDFEVICTDDASTDTTLAVLQRLEDRYSNLYVVQHEMRRGIGSACNSCVRASHGDLLFRLDPRAILEKGSINKLLAFIDNQNFEAISCGKITQINLKENEKDIIFHTKRGYYRFKDIFRSPYTPIWLGNYLFTKRSYVAVGGYPEYWEPIDAFVFGFRQLQHGIKIGFVRDTSLLFDNDIEQASSSDEISQAFFRFLLEYEHLFTLKSVWHIEKELRMFDQTACFSEDYFTYLSEQKIRLR